MRHALLVILLVFLAATHSAASGLPDVERSRGVVFQQSALHDEYGQQQAGEAIEKCCVKELIEKSSSQSPCSTDCTYLLTNVDVLFSGCPETHDPYERAWRAPIACQTLLRPPIV